MYSSEYEKVTREATPPRALNKAAKNDFNLLQESEA
jgi:hypothetical protein